MDVCFPPLAAGRATVERGVGGGGGREDQPGTPSLYSDVVAVYTNVRWASVLGRASRRRLYSGRHVCVCWRERGGRGRLAVMDGRTHTYRWISLSLPKSALHHRVLSQGCIGPKIGLALTRSLVVARMTLNPLDPRHNYQ